MKIDNTQILAAAIAYAKKEIHTQVESIRKDMPVEFSEAEKSVFASQIIQETLKKVPITELPEGIIFESHLEDQKKKLIKEFLELNNQTNISFNSSFSDLVSKLAIIEAAFNSHDHNEQYSKLSHEHDYAPSQHDHSQYAEKTELQSLEQNINSRLEDSAISTIEQMSGVNSKIRELSEVINNKILDSISSLKKYTDLEIENLQVYINNKIALVQDSVKNLDSDIKQYKTEVAFDKIQTSDEILKIKNELYSKVDSSYKHPGLADKDHKHYDLASTSDVNDLKDQIKTLLATDTHLKNTLFSLQGMVQSKLSKSEALTKKDLQDVIDFMTSDILSKLPPPIPGKDAISWEFRLKPNDPTVFQFKKETDDKWTSVVPAHVVQPPASFLGVGGGGADFRPSIETVKTKIINLSGFSRIITPIDHQLSTYYSYRVYNNLTNQDVQLMIQIDGLTFTLNSIIPMNNLVIELKGV